MTFVPSFTQLLQDLSSAMTMPTFQNFQLLLIGWVHARRRTVTGMIVAAGLVNFKHHCCFHRLFSQARWSLDQLGLLVLTMLIRYLGCLLPEAATIFIAIDDTLARKRGLKTFGTGMHHNPQLSSRSYTVTQWSHSWVVLSVVLVWDERVFSLPILFRLYLNKKSAQKERCVYRTKPELAVELLQLLCTAHKMRHFHVLADSSYGGQSVLGALPGNCHLTSRLVLDARLYGLRTERQPGTNGRPRKRGKLLPTPQMMLSKRARRLSLKIYGRTDKVRYVETLACVHKVPERCLRVVVIEALRGGRGREAFYSTDTSASAKQILVWYAQRWSIEVAFHDSKQQLGFEQPQGWSRRAVERTAPVAMLLYTLIVLWFVRTGHVLYRPVALPWYQSKRHASFADMLATLKRASIREHVLQWGLTGRGSRKALKTLENLLTLAA